MHSTGMLCVAVSVFDERCAHRHRVFSGFRGNGPKELLLRPRYRTRPVRGKSKATEKKPPQRYFVEHRVLIENGAICKGRHEEHLNPIKP